MCATYGMIRIWNKGTGELVQEIRAHSQRIRAMQFSPDGSQLASAGEDRVIAIWDPKTGTEKTRLQSNGAKVMSLCFNPSRSPAAIRICSLTISRPVTISVTGCSTCSRVFASMK